MAAKLQPPHLKAIFPFDPRGAYGEAGRLSRRISRRRHPPVSFSARSLLGHHQKGQAQALPPEREKLWQQAMTIPTSRCIRTSTMCWRRKASICRPISTPDRSLRQGRSGTKKRGRIQPNHYSHLYRLGLVRLHVQDPSQRRAELVSQHQVARRSSCSPAPRISIARSRRFTTRCCAGTTTGSKGSTPAFIDDPPVRFWVMGANEWRSGSDWPLPETQWIKFYLRGWERLTPEPFVPASADDYQTPDAFVQMPPARPDESRSCAI